MARLLKGEKAAAERGAGMIIALTVTLIVFSIGAAWIGLGTHQAIGSGRDSLRERARNAAEAGLNAAMGRLAAEPNLAGLPVSPLPGAEFEVDVLPVAADATRRLIVAKGYAPAKAHPRRVARRLEQQIDLRATDGFRYTVFVGAGGMTAANQMTIMGDMYSANDITLSNNATVSGNVVSLGKVTTQGHSTIGGDVRAAGNVVISSTTTVLGNVYSGGDVTVLGRVKGNVQAAGTIAPGGTVDGSRALYSPPPPPPALSLPVFTWDPARYVPGTVFSWATPGAFQTHWASTKAAFSGHHRVLCAVPCPTAVDFNSKWTLTNDVTIVADGPVVLSRDVVNLAGRPITLTIISLATDGVLPAIAMSGNVTVPDDVHIVFYAPDGSVKFTNLKHFTGTVYAKRLAILNQFQLTFAPVTVPGFDWGPASSSHFQIQAGPFAEVPFA